MTRVEWLLVASCAIVACACLLPFVGGPLSWDELRYMHAALNPEPQPEILNRYFHIYAQKLFFALAGEPLGGAKLYWSLLVSVTLAATYANARLISGGRNVACGLVAVVLMLAQAEIFHFSGVTYADFTLMALVSVATLVYLLWARSASRGRMALLVVLGLIIYCSARSKETAVCLVVLLAGVLAEPGRGRPAGRALGRATLLLFGFSLGGAALAALDRKFLGDAWFSLRPENFSELFGYNLGDWQRRKASWFLYGARSWLLLPFLLYLARGAWLSGRHRPLRERMVWLLPLGLLAFLTLTMIKGRWGVVARYFIPAIPLVCVSAAQFFAWPKRDPTKSEPRRPPSRRFLAWAAAGGPIALAWVAWSNAHAAAGEVGWKKGDFYLAIVNPLAVSGILACLVLFPTKNRICAHLMLFCLAVSLCFPLSYNAHRLYTRVDADRSRERFRPLAAFADRLRADDATRIFVSSSIYKKHKIFGRGARSCRWMFNLYFDENLGDRQFGYSGDLGTLGKQPYTHAFLCADEWDRIASDPGWTEVVARYEPIEDPEKRVVLLIRR